VFATGLTIGSERTVVPALGEDVLGVESFFVIGSFVVSFGIVKSILNLYAGKWGEEYGRKPVLIAGWITALPSQSSSSSPRAGAGSPSGIFCWVSIRR